MTVARATLDALEEAQRADSAAGPGETGGSRIDEQNPWPGLDAFDEAAQRFFHGRDREAAELLRLVLSSPLTVVFGASGLGKTSLLKAGLFPLLRRNNVLPVYVRLNVLDRTGQLIDQLKNALRKQFEDRQVDAPGFREAEPLWEWLHRDNLELWSAQNQLLTPLFVLDQFEEVFTHGLDNPDSIRQLRVDLADLIENRIPGVVAERIRSATITDADLSLDSQRYKVLLSFREDFLPHLEGWKRDLPSLMRNRLRLLPMSGTQAFDAVHGTAPHLVDEATARAIVRFVAAAQRSVTPEALDEGVRVEDLSVEPALLSLMCHRLNLRRKAQGKAVFDLALLQDSGQSIIAEHYRDAVSGMPELVEQFIENELITHSGGSRRMYPREDARSVYGLTDNELQHLIDRRLLRIERQRDDEYVELIHDRLTETVRERRQERERARQEQERARLEREKLHQQRKQQRKLAAVAAVGAAALIAGLFFWGRWEQRQAREQEAQAIVLEGQYAWQQQQQALIDSLLLVLNSITAARETTPDVQNVAAELQALSTTHEAGRITALVQQMNDESRDVRISAARRLQSDHDANPMAIAIVLNELSEQRLGYLSADGRINMLYFLNASELKAWSEEHKRLAREAIQRIRTRAEDGTARIGGPTRAQLDTLTAKIST